jgi:orotate phosphoribosyltransferase-like protein
MTPPAKKTASKNLAEVKKANNAALALEKENKLAMEAYQLRQAGVSWWDIAEQLKISEQYASNLVQHKIKEAARLVDEGIKKSMLTMEIDRLDSLQKAVWNDAMLGDRQAVETALKIIMARAKVLGLDAIPTSTVTNNTIVVSGTPDEYVNALKKVSELPIINHEDI